MTQDFTSQSSTGKIIAGSLSSDGVGNGRQKIFNVRKEILEKSPVIKGWIEEPETMPESLQMDGALYLPNCDPEIVETLIRYLETGHDTTSTEYEFDFDDKVTESLPFHTQDPIFYLRLYKLAGSLALERLCMAALRRIRTRKYDAETFVRILMEAEKGKLIEAGPFREWMIAYMARNSDTLRESPHIRSTIMEGGQKAWGICSALMSFLGNLKTDTALPKSGSVGNVTTSYAFTPPSSSKRSVSAPLNTRQSRSYLKSYQKSPSSSPGSSRVEKKRRTERRGLNATVEDAVE
ncbi:hypothetical protein BGZ60DRAFT_396904 [Tricladium varicosporioides]|nr:hypothetical protein BGZ60DRAFT_396904 [Hymenoscyphus varicosporioides]